MHATPSQNTPPNSPAPHLPMTRAPSRSVRLLVPPSRTGAFVLAPPDGGPELGLGMVIVRSFCRPKLKRMADIIKSKAIVMSARESTRRRYLRFVAEANVCSYCGEDLDGHGPRMLYDNVRLPLVEGRHHGLCYNRGVWWYRPMGPCAGDVWARFYSWREECIPDNDQYHKTASVVLHRCRLCLRNEKY